MADFLQDLTKHDTWKHIRVYNSMGGPLMDMIHSFKVGCGNVSIQQTASLDISLDVFSQHSVPPVVGWMT